MKAIDTNVLVRAITEDDEAQYRPAMTVVAEGVFVSSGVLIETEWVLRSAYGWSRGRIADAFRALIAAGDVTLPEADAFDWAIDRYARGADWADMVHLIDSRAHGAFVTFDRALASKAGPQAPVAIELLP